jgi:hypothetical protein
MSVLSPIILALAVSAAAPAPQPETPPAAAAQQGAAPGPNSTTVCRFQTGPLAGQTRDFGGAPGAKPFAKGAPCTDGKDSVGVAQADRASASPSADRAGADASAGGYRCRFSEGPKAGRTGEFQPPARGFPRPGGACSDGRGSRGRIVR